MKFTRSENGYGWWLDIGSRIRWHSRKATSRMWPRIRRGGDENCNPTITLVLWPLGHLDVWWKPGRLRTLRDGPCIDCRTLASAEGCCEWCGSRPCCCEVYGYVKS